MFGDRIKLPPYTRPASAWIGDRDRPLQQGVQFPPLCLGLGHLFCTSAYIYSSSPEWILPSEDRVAVNILEAVDAAL